ncbi:MAG: PGPGW domain-containing protein [Candidatus Nanopelagicales bacterium]|nr:PGPGW domain-containing protein [Candidatus Nanopelagicales bacterium]
MTTAVRARNRWSSLPGPLRKIAVAVAGGAVMAAGAAMLVLPGPGIAGILVGLAILATEFMWARTALAHARRRWHDARARVPRRRRRDRAPQGDARADHHDPDPHHITRGT